MAEDTAPGRALDPGVGPCPVCGDRILGPPRTCTRCDTPHHAECWDYVPGCAVFACEEGALVRADEWPRAHRLVLWRARALVAGARALRGGALALVAALPLADLARGTSWWLADAAMAGAWGLIFLGLASVPLAWALGAVAVRSGGAELLARAGQRGDAKLADALEARASVPWARDPDDAARKLGAAYGLGMFLAVMAVAAIPEITASGVPLLAAVLYPLAVGLVSALAGRFVGRFLARPLLRISAGLVGSQQILVHRLRAPLGPAKPTLALEAGGEGEEDP